MKWTLSLRLAACLMLGASSWVAAAATQIAFSGTTDHSTLVANGLPLTGMVSFDPSAPVTRFKDASNGVNTVAYTVPGTAEFTVSGQTYNYQLSDILLNDVGAVGFFLADPLNASNALFVLVQTSNTDISVIPGPGTLYGVGVANAHFPEGSDAAIFADIFLGTAPVPEPATWALMLVGFGAVGYGMRRRRQISSGRFRTV